MMDLWKMQFTVITFKVGSFLSFLGTGFVIFEVLTDRQKRAKTYFRLLLGLCVIEFIESMVLFCGTWCTPADWVWWGSSGNQTTCNFQGFLNQISVGSSMYSAFLAVYYLLAIRYNVVERYIRKYIEPWMHFVTLSWSFGTAIATLLLDLIRPLGTICYIGRTPRTCEQTYQYGYTTCEQGDNAQLYLMVFFYSWFFISFAVTLISMGMVWLGIRSQENRMAQYNHDSDYAANRKLSQRFALQGTLYVVVMWLCNIWTVVNFLRIQVVGKGIPAISMIASVLKPLEGFLNFLIYIRPRLLLKSASSTRRPAAASATEVSQVVAEYHASSSSTTTTTRGRTRTNADHHHYSNDSSFRKRVFSIFNLFGASSRTMAALNKNDDENDNNNNGGRSTERTNIGDDSGRGKEEEEEIVASNRSSSDRPPPNKNDSNNKKRSSSSFESGSHSSSACLRPGRPSLEGYKNEQSEHFQDAEEQMRLGAF